MKLAVFLLSSALLCCNAQIYLATFDGAPKTTYPWRVMNDPVMGGVSVSTVYINKTLAAAVWDGQVKIVPSLKAPGFCNYETEKAELTRFADISSTTHLLLRVRTSSPEYAGYKVSFAADTLNPQFKSFKANFNITGTDWTTVAIPFNSFSNDWSPYTGNCDTLDPTGVQHHCCSAQHPEVCPTKRNLRGITQLGLWTEGASGNFHLEIQWIGAGNASYPEADLSVLPELEKEAPLKAQRDSCANRVQSHLRFNVSGRLASDYLPLTGFLPLESLAFAVCCDTQFAAFSEPADFYARPDVDLFSHLSASGPTVFYDTTCGIPVFAAPVNRTLEDFMADTKEHTWPSFRPGEIFLDNVIINATTGDIRSKCGTHLGSYDPDSRGARYCIDLSCISGNKL